MIQRFKLHLSSRVGAGKSVTNVSEIPPLPPSKTVVEVFADFLSYLLKCAKTYITQTHPSGDDLWTYMQNDIDYVLSHPNGWEGKEQADMRCAAVLAKLIPDTKEGHARLTFVTEGEASLHFAVHNGLPLGALEVGRPFLDLHNRLLFTARRGCCYRRCWRRNYRYQLVQQERRVCEGEL